MNDLFTTCLLLILSALENTPAVSPPCCRACPRPAWVTACAPCGTQPVRTIWR